MSCLLAIVVCIYGEGQTFIQFSPLKLLFAEQEQVAKSQDSIQL